MKSPFTLALSFATAALLVPTSGFAASVKPGDVLLLPAKKVECRIDRKVTKPCEECFPVPGDEVESGAGMIGVLNELEGIEEFYGQTVSCPRFLAELAGQDPVPVTIDWIHERATVPGWVLRRIGLRVGSAEVQGFVHERLAPRLPQAR